MGFNTSGKGKVGENIAADYLKEHKYKILERNAKYIGVEVDIIALDGDTIVFCEVKTRTDNFFSTPAEAVTKEKQRRYIQAANGYIVKKRAVNKDFRFDVIEVSDEGVNHIIDAFRP